MTDGARREKSDLAAIFAARALWKKSPLRSHPATGAVRWAEELLFKGAMLYPGTAGLIDSLIERAGRHARPGGNSFFPEFRILLLKAKRHDDLATLTWIHEQIEEMEEVLAQSDDAATTVLPPELEEPKEKRSQKRARLTNVAKRKCKQWLEEQVASGKRWKKDEAWEEVRKQLGPQLSRRSFNAIWREVVPDNWKHPGHRPESTAP